MIRINHLPVSTTRWQHWSWICFATFIYRKVTKLQNNSETTEATEIIGTDLKFLEFSENCVVCLTKFISNPILFNKISH